jgi:hypothetical protein
MGPEWNNAAKEQKLFAEAALADQARPRIFFKKATA